jgi:hypothetical protein
VAPAHAAGSVKLKVTNPGLPATTWSQDFVYSLPVSLDAFAPVKSWTSGGAKITITGSNFAVGNKVTVGSAPAIDVVVADGKTITFTLPSGEAGLADIVVTGNDGISATLSGVIQYVFAPSLKVVFSGKSTKTTTSTNKAIVRFIKLLAANPMKVKSLVISAYTASSKPSLSALTLAISRAKSVKQAVTASKTKLKMTFKALAATTGKTGAVFITVN